MDDIRLMLDSYDGKSYLKRVRDFNKLVGIICPRCAMRYENCKCSPNLNKESSNGN